jgi:DNA polymerase IV
MLWRRAIILMDMNAFFASVEQYDFPELRGQPVAVTNGEIGTCIITASYEARAFGIKTGMRLKEARVLCSHLKVCPSRPKRYAEISSLIMQSLEKITPDIEVFSIDEAFLDVTHCQLLLGSPEVIAQQTKQLVYEVSGLLCSVGVSGDKTTAKFAAKQKKPNGLTVILPEESESTLANVLVTELCGIAEGVGRFLAARGVYHCGDMKKIPISVLGKRFGNIGRRIWLMCQGQDPEPVKIKTAQVKSLGHGKVMPPNTNNITLIKTYLRHMCEKLALRLRNNSLEAQYFFIGFRLQKNKEWMGDKIRLMFPMQHGEDIYNAGVAFLSRYWKGEAFSQIQVTALDPKPKGLQGDLFQDANDIMSKSTHNEKLDSTIDNINQRFGAFSIMSGSLLDRSLMHDVISPAWRPEGSRRSI